jgi:AAA+ superfamily predicted ATPase
MLDFHKIDFFHAEAWTEIKDKIYDLIYSNDRGFYLIYGNSGVGKSRLIKTITNELDENIFLIEDAPEVEREFYESAYLQLRQKQFSKNVKIDEIRIRVNDAFKKLNHTIIIDNIRDPQSNFLKELATHKEDIKDLKIVIVVSSKNVGDEIDVEFKDFFKVPEIFESDLSIFLNEFEEYQEILQDYSNFIFQVTSGNFGKLEKLLGTAFDIVETAQKENLEKFKELNECILIMSAIDNEFVEI